MARERQIVAMGGGGFLMEPENPRLDDYILSLSGKKRPKLCLIATASGDAESYFKRFYDAFPQTRCEPTHLALFTRKERDLRSFLLGQDVIYVSGGNTANLLAVWRVHGVDAILREAWESGVVLAGVSAGSLCWFECGVTDSFGPELAPLYGGLGFLSGSNCPHYDGEVMRRPMYHRFLKEGLAPGFAADDGAALHFQGATLLGVVSSRPAGGGYRVELSEGEVQETAIEPTRL